MKPKLQLLKLSTISLWTFLFVLVPAAANGQGKNSRDPGRNNLMAGARDIMIGARYCALITVDSTGRPQARTMDPFPPTESMVVWFATNPKSRKVREIRHNPRVALYYFDPSTSAYVAIQGIARLVDDPKEKAKRWKDEWEAFYPDRGKHYLLIVVTPDKLEVVSEKKGMTGDSRTWTPPSIRFKSQKSNR